MKALNFVVKWALYPFVWSMVHMPGRKHKGALPLATNQQTQLSGFLKAHVDTLCTLGERNARSYEALTASVAYIRHSFEALGYTVKKQDFTFANKVMTNLEVEVKGSKYPERIIVVGAHYDTVYGSPGADDNASGTASLLEMARLLRDHKPDYTIRLVAFANEEHPEADWHTMGSYEYARACHERKDDIRGMMVLEMLGCYSDAPNSQQYPYPFNLFYPTVGNFIAFVGNTKSRAIVTRAIEAFRKNTAFPSEGVSAPEKYRDIQRSDHSCFWDFGYQALMITDTSNFRYRPYHTAEDTPEKLDYERMARVTEGLAHSVMALASAE